MAPPRDRAATGSRSTAPPQEDDGDERGFTRAGENGRLKLAVPAKGRMAEPALRLCADAGLSFEVTERSLVVPCANAPVDLLLVRPSDIPEYVAGRRRRTSGITGANLVVEAEADVVTLAELGFAPLHARRRGARSTRRSRELADLDGLRVATAYPASTERLLRERGVRLRARSRLGLGRGDAAARARRRDRRPRLDRLDDGRERPAADRHAARRHRRCSSAAAAAIEEQRDLVDRLELMLSGVVAARGRRYVMMNARVDDLPAIRAVLPGMGAPTVLQLADEGEIAVHAAVDADESGRCSRALRDAGAHVDPRAADREARAVRGAVLDEALAIVAPIVADVRERGDAALLEWTERFDGPRPDGLRVDVDRDRGGASSRTTCSTRSAG